MKSVHGIYHRFNINCITSPAHFVTMICQNILSVYLFSRALQILNCHILPWCPDHTAAKTSVNQIWTEPDLWTPVVSTSCVGLREEEPQTVHSMCFTWVSHIAASSLDVKLYPINLMTLPISTTE